MPALPARALRPAACPDRGPVAGRSREMECIENTPGRPSLSHIVEIKTEVRDPAAVASACRRLGLTEPVNGTATLFSGEATGLLVKLPGWVYHAVFDTAAGTVRFDNYQGSWGDPEQLDKFMQAYSVEKAKIEAKKKGYTVTEQALADGSIRLTVQVGGAA
jgi:hypothetical protein